MHNVETCKLIIFFFANIHLYVLNLVFYIYGWDRYKILVGTWVWVVHTYTRTRLSVFWVRPHTRGCPSRCF